VQVKSTVAELEDGYRCTVRGGHKAYRVGSFDFLAAYVVPDDAWYIIPARLIRRKESLTLYPKSKTAKYEQYREAWHLLKEASEVCGEVESHPSKTALRLPSGRAPDGAADGLEQSEDEQTCAGDSAAVKPGSIHPGNIEQRMEWIANRVRNWMERSKVRQEKAEDESQ
jgi:hypothetical protein